MEFPNSITPIVGTCCEPPIVVVDVGGVAIVIGNILEYHGLIDLDVMKESAEKRGEAVSKYQRIIDLVGDIWVAQ